MCAECRFLETELAAQQASHEAGESGLNVIRVARETEIVPVAR